MAFTIDYTARGPTRKVRALVNGIDAAGTNLVLDMPEQSRGHYSAWAHVPKGRYQICVVAGGVVVVGPYVVDHMGRPSGRNRSGKMVTFVGGILHIDGVAQAPVVTYQARSASNGLSIRTAVRWSNGWTSCDCPAWTNGRRNSGITLADRCKTPRCKHTKAVAALQQSVSITGTTLPGPADAVVAPVRSGRGVELD
jgi:hypothetical protein